MIISEITKIDDFDSKNLFWSISIIIYMGTIFYVIPLFLILNLLNISILNLFKSKVKIVTAIIFYLIYLLSSNFLYHLFKGNLFSLSSVLFYISFSSITEYLGFLSIVISSVLSAYGSAQLIFNLLLYPVFKAEYYTKRFVEKFDRLQNLKNQYNYNPLETGINTNKTDSHNEVNTKLYSSIRLSNRESELINEEKEFFINDLEVELNLLTEKNKFNDRLFKEIYNKGNKIEMTKLKYVILKLASRILMIYSLYRVFNTVRNLIFSDYSNINISLREDALTLIDWVVYAIAFLFQTEFDEIYYRVVEQYFSLLIVSTVILTNIRSFLLLIEFIYQKFLKIFSKVKLNLRFQLLILSYLCCLFYITSTLFLISNLPVKYRNEIAKFYGNIDFSLLKLYYDKLYILFIFVFSIAESVINLLE